MTKSNISQYDATASNNTDIDGTDIAENCSPAGINNAIRSLMSHLKQMDVGTVALTSPKVTGDLTVDTNTLKVDSTNNRVGVGITAPEALTHIAGATADADGALGSQSPQLIIEGGNNNNPFEIGMDNSGATAIGFLQSRNKSAGAQFLALNPKGGNVSIGNTTPEATLDVTGNSDSVAALKLNGGNTTHGFHFFTRNTDGDLSVTREVSGTQTECLKIQRSSGMLTAIGVYNITTSGAANVNVQSSGAVLRSTSSEKYKQNIEDMELSYAQAILNLRPVYYKSKCDQDNADDSHWGFIAEEVEKIDPRLVLYKTLNVTFNDEGMPVEEVLKTPEPEGVQYDRLTPAIVKLLQEQQKTIETLETKVAALEAE